MLNSEELYFDVQGTPLAQGAERIVELVTKISAGVLVTWFSLHELFEELNEYKLLKRTQKKDGQNV